MLILFASLAIFLPALCLAIRTKEVPMDREVVLRIRRFSDQLRREQFLPYE
jgi:hypothetical protein